MIDRERSAGVRQGWRSGVLSARPGEPGKDSFAVGLHRLGVGDQSAALLVPPTLPAGPARLVVLLHGAGSSPREALPYLESEARTRGFLLLAPKSQDYTWDVIRGGFGPDVGTLDLVLEEVFDRFPVDPGRLAIAGFSDGASYALSVGLVNGDLFTDLLAFSPGFAVSGRRSGRPRSSSPTASGTGCCRSTAAAGGWCRSFARTATTSTTASSTGGTSSARNWWQQPPTNCCPSSGSWCCRGRSVRWRELGRRADTCTVLR